MHTSRVRVVILLLVLACLSAREAYAQNDASQAAPIRLAVAGLVHGHVRGFLDRLKDRPDVQLVGIFEPDEALRRTVLSDYHQPSSLGFASLDTMLDQARPDAVAIFSTTKDHPAIVEAAARRHVHAMMEKPLAVSVDDARRIESAARSGNVHVIVNYETTWYPSLGAVWQLFHEQRAGCDIRRIVAMDGHEGPKEIGVGPEFLGWLTDPVQNGAGALFDFGCYGANLMTWLMNDARPVSVRAITQQIKSSIYPKVDDEATILVEYPKALGIIEASWNWPFGRKDLEVYTEGAYAIATGASTLRVRLPKQQEESRTPEALPPAHRDPVSYLLAIVRGTEQPSGPSSLANNVIVTEILAAARESARSGKAVRFAAQ